MSELKEKPKPDVITTSVTAVKNPNPAEMSFCHVNKEMLRFKLHFFLFNCALACTVPYITVIAQTRIGMNASSLAAIMVPQMILYIVTKPIFGYLADYFNKLKAMIFVLTAMQCLFFFLILCVPKITRNEGVIMFGGHLEALNVSSPYDGCHYTPDSLNPFYTHTGGESWTAMCSIKNETYEKTFGECGQVQVEIKNISSESSWKDTTESKSISCDLCCDVIAGCNLTTCRTTDGNGQVQSDFATSQFWVFAVFNVVAFVSLSSVFTLSDTSCCESVEKIGADFGRQRAWAALGWGLMAPLSGFLNDYTDDYVVSFTVMAVLFVVTLWNVSQIDMVKPHFSQNILNDVGTVMRNFEFLVFQFGVFLNGIAIGNIWYYTLWYVTMLGGSRLLCGLVHSVECFFGELPFFFYSGWIIKKIGHYNVITLSLVAYCVRFFWYAHLPDVWWILPAEVLHGLSYGLFYPAVAGYAKLNAKPGTEATTISVLFTTFEGIGGGIGCVMAGYGFDHLGGRQTYLVASIFSGCGAILLLMLQCIIRNRKKSFMLDILPTS